MSSVSYCDKITDKCMKKIAERSKGWTEIRKIKSKTVEKKYIN
jgi:hypothetical protein